MHPTHLSKLIHVLRALNESQFKRLREYLHSAYFHTSVSSLALFDYLLPLYPVFSDKKINVDAIALKEVRLPDLNKQRKAGTDLLQSVEGFIALENWRRDKNDVMKNRLAGYKELNLFELFNKEYDKAVQQLADCTEQDIETFYYRHLFAEIAFQGVDATISKSIEDDLNPLLQTLDEFTALKKLRYLCEAMNRKETVSVIYQGNYISQVLKILKPYTTEHYPCVFLFVNIYKMLIAKTYESSKIYSGIIKKFVIGYNKIESSQSIRTCVGYVLSNYVAWLNRGFKEAGEEYVWWLGLKMEHGWLLENGLMLPKIFRNIVITAVNTNQTEWLQMFIEYYGKYLPQEYRETNLAFAKGLLFYSLKKYKESVRYLLIAQAKEEPIFNCIIRRWYWLCMYECTADDTDTLHNHLVSFEKYLVRHNEELRQYEASFSKFIFYAGALIKSNGHGIADHTIRNLQLEGHFSGKDWILEQLGKGRQQRTQRNLLVTS